MHGSSYLNIDLASFHHNLTQLIASFGQVMPMVKANAYGTDLLLLSKFIQSSQLKGIPYLGVSHIWEGVQLREAGITLPIFVLSAPPYEADWAIQYRLTAAVSSLEEIKQLNCSAKKYGKRIGIHLHLDTGMNRFGASDKEGNLLYREILESSHLDLEGVMTHFVAAESIDFDPFTEQQIQKFKQFLLSLPTLPKWIHAGNSAGAVRFPLPYCNLVRIGLGSLGYGCCLPTIQPPLSLCTTLASVRTCQKGESVGYNRTFKIEKDNARIGVIPVGYHDGLQRALSGKGYVLMHGKKAPMIGTICMDFTMIDLTQIPEATPGDIVTIFDHRLSPETVAGWANTDVREFLATLPPRVKRVWHNLPEMINNTLSTSVKERR